MDLTVTLLASLLVAQAARRGADKPAVPTPDADVPKGEMTVIAALIRHSFGTRRAVVSGATVAGFSIADSEYEKFIDGMMGSAWTRYQQEMVRDFGEKNQHPATIRRGFPKSLPLQVVCRNEISEMFRYGRSLSAGWKRFRERYPGHLGIIKVSRVGFDKKGRRALVYMGCSMGELAGFGQYHVLERRSGKWCVNAAANFVRSRWVS